MFNFSEIKDFDSHINLSIPNYNGLIKQIEMFSEFFIEENTNVYDIGCSTGKLLKRLPYYKNVNYIGIDNSNLIPESDDNYNFIKDDFNNIELKNASLITSIFTLQFMPRSDRSKHIFNIGNALNKYGGVIICEKVYSNNPRLQDITNSAFYQLKNKNFSGDDILKKEQQLRKNLNYLYLNDLIKELNYIGTPEIFWRSYNFVGIIIVR